MRVNRGHDIGRATVATPEAFDQVVAAVEKWRAGQEPRAPVWRIDILDPEMVPGVDEVCGFVYWLRPPLRDSQFLMFAEYVRLAARRAAECGIDPTRSIWTGMTCQ